MSDIPTATPLVEQLKDVPIDGSDCYPISSVHHKNIPYGELCRAAAKEIEQLKRELCEAREALRDMLSGWKYIRSVHGDLYGVGWDRAQSKAETALEGTK